LLELGVSFLLLFVRFGLTKLLCETGDDLLKLQLGVGEWLLVGSVDLAQDSLVPLDGLLQHDHFLLQLLAPGDLLHEQRVDFLDIALLQVHVRLPLHFVV
jgi:hypothetical protein